MAEKSWLPIDGEECSVDLNPHVTESGVWAARNFVLVTFCISQVLNLLYLYGIHFDNHCESLLFDEVLFFTELVLRIIYIDS